jgi:hypothetical protein
MIRVRVTKRDIAGGHREDDCRCPVSLAVRRATGIPTSVTAGAIVVDYATPWQTEIDVDDDAVIDFIGRFDAGRKVSPFAFDLDFDPAAHAARKAAYRAAHPEPRACIV